MEWAEDSRLHCSWEKATITCPQACATSAMVLTELFMAWMSRRLATAACGSCWRKLPPPNCHAAANHGPMSPARSSTSRGSSQPSKAPARKPDRHSINPPQKATGIGFGNLRYAGPTTVRFWAARAGPSSRSGRIRFQSSRKSPRAGSVPVRRRRWRQSPVRHAQRIPGRPPQCDRA